MHSIYADWAADQQIPCLLYQRPVVCQRILNVLEQFEHVQLHQIGENNRTVSYWLSERRDEENKM